MSLTNSDRRRFFLATSLTLLALPALWWVNRSEDSAAPNVAVAGAGVGVDVGVHAGGDAGGDAGDGAGGDSGDGASGGNGGGDGDGASAGESAGALPSTPVDGAAGAGGQTVPSTVPTTTTPPVNEGTSGDELGATPPVFLEGPSAKVGAGLSEIAVPAAPAIARVSTTATFRNDISNRDTCVVPGLLDAATVTIVSLDNGRSVTCATSFVPGALGDQIVLSRHAFAQLADLTDAPIPVEIRR